MFCQLARYLATALLKMTVKKLNIFFTLLLYINFTEGYWRDKNLPSPIRDEDVPTAVEKWVLLPVDHHNRNDGRSWRMRYFEDLRYFQPDGPMYLYINGESNITKEPFEVCQILNDLARDTNGAMFVLEHRYYGKSMPVQVNTTDDMKYLSVSQSLGDMITLVYGLKTQPQYQNSKVVIIGGSYAGNLATWMRQLYPNYIDAAVASSAPVQTQVNFLEYLEVVAYDYMQYGGITCMEAIRQIFQRYEALLSTEQGADQLKQELRVCQFVNLNYVQNQQLLLALKIAEYKNTAQYGATHDIAVDCNDLITKYELTRKRSEKCNNYNNIGITGFNPYDENQVWLYQTCTELGYFQTTDSNTLPFGHRLKTEFFQDICARAFGADFTKERVNRGADHINIIYRGKRPNVTKVVFTNGGLDPWRMLGITQDLNPEAPAHVTPHVSHCRDLNRAPGPYDPPELGHTMEWIKGLIRQWIGV